MNAMMFDELERAWTELDADPDVRVIVNTGTGTAFQTGLDVVELSRNPEALREQSRRTKRAELRLTAWHNQVWKPVIAAVNGVVRRWRPALRGRRRHRDRVEQRDVPRPARVDRAGDGLRGDRAGAQVADGADHAHGPDRPARAAVRRAGLRAGDPEPGRRPARAAARARPWRWPRRSRRTRPPRCARRRRRCGARSSSGLTDACRAGARGAHRHVGPSRPGGRAAGVRRAA